MNKMRFVALLCGAALMLGGLSLAALEATTQIKTERAKEDVKNAVVDGIHALSHQLTERSPAEAALVAERVNLPNVEGHFWLTFLYDDRWQKDPATVRLHNMFLNDARLVEMRRRCRVNSFGQMDPYLVERWRKYVGDETPMLVLQAPDGKLCYKASRANIPATADELVRQIQQSLDERFCRPCPQPEPAPVEPGPAPVAPVNPLPDTIGPAELPRDAGDPLWLLAVLGVTGIAIGVVLARKRR